MTSKDLIFLYIIPKDADNLQFVTYINNILKDIGENTYIKDNDILNEYGKVCGVSGKIYQDYVVVAGFVSYSDNLSTINEIGFNYDPDKIPSYCRNSTREQFINGLIRVLS